MLQVPINRNGWNVPSTSTSLSDHALPPLEESSSPFRSDLMAMARLLLALASASALEATQPAAQGTAAAATQYHGVELFNSDSTTLEQVLGVFEKLGASREKVMPLIEKIDSQGKAVVVAGSKESCDSAADLFHAIGMKTEVRLLTKEDLAAPSEYDGSDVLLASAEELNELIGTGQGFMINFFAPWCGHCKTMAPAYKEAATALKPSGVRLVAMDGQAYPTIARQLGVSGYPSVKWLQMQGESLIVAEYQGGRDAASFVRFAEAAAKEGALQPKAAAAEAEEGGAAPAKAEGGAAGSKLAQSKLAASAAKGEGETKVEGVQKAAMPAEASA
ncbi:hypothetical protein AB1Y20_003538 [Prymnesium parvum]|uniref:Thioredoxin domain-containing protein n=1 Tax=Prymnesium parvum TaxID=97485 RepID=A0AB34J512_PRYPA